MCDYKSVTFLLSGIHSQTPEERKKKHASYTLCTVSHTTHCLQDVKLVTDSGQHHTSCASKIKAFVSLEALTSVEQEVAWWLHVWACQRCRFWSMQASFAWFWRRMTIHSSFFCCTEIKFVFIWSHWKHLLFIGTLRYKKKHLSAIGRKGQCKESVSPLIWFCYCTGLVISGFCRCDGRVRLLSVMLHTHWNTTFSQ